jgi:hypothetical protein
MRFRNVAAACVVVLAFAGAALASGAWRFVDVHRNEAAVFKPGGWRCNNLGPRVECQNGDAFPYAVLTGSEKGGVTVKVVRLSGNQRGHLRTTRDRFGHLVYVFSAF